MNCKVKIKQIMITLSLSATLLSGLANVRLGYVTGEDVVIRKEASVESDKVVAINDKGTNVKIIGSKNDFFLVEYEGNTGYVSDKFLVVVDAKTGSVVGDDVTLREKPTTKSDKLDSLDGGTALEVFQEEDDFYCVIVNNKIGYISKDYVAIETPIADVVLEPESEKIYIDLAAINQEETADTTVTIDLFDLIPEEIPTEIESPEKEQSSRDQDAWQAEVGNYSKEELHMAAKLIYAEGSNQSTEGFEAMASIIYNRLQSKKFPNSIEGIVYQKGQFTVVKRKNFSSLEPSEKAIAAVEKVFVKGNIALPKDVMFFKSARLSKSWGSRKYYATISGNMYYS